MVEEDVKLWWRRNRRRGLVVGGLVLLVILVGIIQGAKSKRQQAAPAGPSFNVVGFYENQSPGDTHPGSRSSFDAHWRYLTTVTPRWFAVNPGGSVTDVGYDSSLVSAAHRHHIRVVPLVTNAGGQTSVLWAHATRIRAARNLAQIVNKDGLDGVNIDFELLSPASRPDLTRFVADVARFLRPERKVVAVSVFPLVGLPSSINGAYDYRSLAQVANYLVLMAYDHHYSGGPAGPVAPYWWVKANVHAALQQVPGRQLVLAIGMYGYDWINNGLPGNALTIPDYQAKQMADTMHRPIQYSSSSSQNRFTYVRNGVSHVVYFMGDRSAQIRLALAKKEHLAGIALWRLGYEDAGFFKRLGA